MDIISSIALGIKMNISTHRTSHFYLFWGGPYAEVASTTPYNFCEPDNRNEILKVEMDSQIALRS